MDGVPIRSDLARCSRCDWLGGLPATQPIAGKGSDRRKEPDLVRERLALSAGLRVPAVRVCQRAVGGAQ